MAVLPQATHSSSGPKKLTPRSFVKDVALDPGIVFGVADVLLFAKTNPVGFIACLSATGISVGLKTLHLAQPKFLQNYTRLAEIAGDSRTALRASGMALLVVGGAAVTGGAFLPATAGFLLAVGNFRLAQSLSDAMDAHKLRQQKEKDKKAALESGALIVEDAPAPVVKINWQQKTAQIATLSVKRPDLYINAGFACAGLMAGGAALFVLPVVAVAFVVSMKNIVQNKPEHIGHPKMMTAAAGFTFAGIGVAEGHGMIAAAHAINASILSDAERRVTPGGIRAIGENIRGGLAKLLRLDKLQKPEPVDHPIPVPFDAHDLGEDAAPTLPENGKLKQHFNVPVPDHKPEPKPQPATALAEGTDVTPPASAQSAQNEPATQSALNDNNAHSAPSSNNDDAAVKPAPPFARRR
ncbi:MAG: hypothetical protein Q8K65_00290 [Alphaproteobacteria bacterium]|nr:hypothetical protein [Alphaproteobacteria bacterium]